EQTLSKTQRIHDHWADTSRTFDIKPVLVLLRQRTRGADHLVDQRGDIHSVRVDVELSRLDLRQIKYLIDEIEQMLSRAVNAPEWFYRLFRPEPLRIADHHIAQPNDGI